MAFVMPSLPLRPLRRTTGLMSQMVAQLSALIPVSRPPGAPRRVEGSKPMAAVSLSLADQWGKLSNILATAVTQADSASKLQKSATQQLDLAQYALSNLVDELASVMAVDGRRDRIATLYVLGNGIGVPAYNSAAARRSASGKALAA